MAEEVVVRFSDVTFEYEHKKPLLDEASFSVRKGAKVILMGQNGAGKSTIFSLIKGDLKPKSGNATVAVGATIGTARQVVSRADFGLTVAEYFAKDFEIVPPGLKSEMSKVLEVVNLVVPLDRPVGEELAQPRRCQHDHVGSRIEQRDGRIACELGGCHQLRVADDSYVHGLARTGRRS